MRTNNIGVAAPLMLLAGSGVLSQASGASPVEHATTRSVAAGAVDKWVHDTRGAKIGSVCGLADGGRTAAIMVGSYFQPGSHEERVPTHTLSMVDGKVTLDAGTAQALNDDVRR